MFESARDILKPKHGGVGVGHGFSKLQVLTLWRIELLGYVVESLENRVVGYVGSVAADRGRGGLVESASQLAVFKSVRLYYWGN